MAVYFEDYQIGDTRRSRGRTITETDIVIHAGQTGCFFPHHMGAEGVKTQPFGQRIAHGTLVLSVAVGLTADRINPVAFAWTVNAHSPHAKEAWEWVKFLNDHAMDYFKFGQLLPTRPC